MGASVLVMFQFLETEGDQESTEVVEVVNLDWDSDSDRRIRSCQSAGVSISQFRDCGCVYVCVLVTRSCLTFCDLMDCSPPGSSVHGILKARILGWVAISSSRGSSVPRTQTWVSHIADRFFTF